jgi:hypothetical protein
VGCYPKERAVGDSRVAPGPRAAPVEAVAGPVVGQDEPPCCPDAPGVAGVSLPAGAWRPDDFAQWFEEASGYL